MIKIGVNVVRQAQGERKILNLLLYHLQDNTKPLYEPLK